ncbi:MAG: glycosyltransferase [bacterium]|jgi:ceramide glucosyltransferase
MRRRDWYAARLNLGDCFTAVLAIFVICSAAYCLLVLLAAAKYRAESRREAHGGANSEPASAPPVSVITPVSGAEPGLAENLRSSFEQDYPEFEVLIVAHAASDPAVAVAEKLIAAYPHVKARVVISGLPPCPNAKVFNLEAAVAAARHGILVMKDSDVRAGSDMLSTLAAEFAGGDVALITCPYRALSSRGFWWLLDAIGTNTRFFGGVLVARMLGGMDFALGPTLAIRKDALERLGGLAQFRDYLAEDFLLGNRAHSAGMGVILSSYCVDHHFGGGSAWSNFRHRLRWSRSTRRSRGFAYLGELFTHPVPLALALWIWAPAWWPLAAAAFALRAVGAWMVAWRVLGARLGAREWLLMWLDDIAAVVFWAAGLFGNRISWRGRQYVLGAGGRFTRVS